MAEYEIVTPKVDLRKKVKVIKDPDFDPIARAEQAMKRLSANFNIWMDDEVNGLQKAWAEIDAKGINEDTLKELFRASHDIKGQAHTMGYPIAGTIAGSMCNLIENITDPSALPKELLHKHVQAIRAVVKEDARAEDNAIGKALASELLNISDEIVQRFEQAKSGD